MGVIFLEHAYHYYSNIIFTRVTTIYPYCKNCEKAYAQAEKPRGIKICKLHKTILSTKRDYTVNKDRGEKFAYSLYKKPFPLRRFSRYDPHYGKKTGRSITAL